MSAAGDAPHAPQPEAARGDNIVLIGYRGAGKTTIGRLLAQRLARPFIDVDEQIILDQHRSIREIFEQSGEAAFRAAERTAIAAATRQRSHVISVGGGAVLNADNRTRLRNCGRCIWLSAAPAELLRRVTADPATAATRPALTAHDPAEEIRRVLTEREPLYAALADIRLDTTDLEPQIIVEKLTALLVHPHDPE